MVRYVHTNIVAIDAQKLIGFYVSALGCEHVGQTRDLRGEWLDGLTGLSDAHITGEHLLLPGYGGEHPTLEIFQYDEHAEDLPREINRPGFAHLAFEADDVDAALSAVLHAGGSAVGKTVSTAYEDGRTLCVVYARDPEGNIIELQSWGQAAPERGRTADALETRDLYLRPAEIGFAPALLDYFVRNQFFLKDVEPRRDAHFYTLEYQEAQLRRDIAAMHSKTGFRFYLFAKGDPKTVIGTVGLSSVIRGGFQSCFLGYRLDQRQLNRGYMTQAVNAAVRFAFDTLRLHRVEANVMPRNAASRRVLEKCGFREEGLARRYLQINGVWEDHIHMVLRNETTDTEET